MEYIDRSEYRIVQLVPAPAGWRVYAEDGGDSVPVACFALMESAKVNQQFVAPIVSTSDGLIPTRFRAVPADERDYVVYSLTDQAIAEAEERERREAKRPLARTLWEAIESADTKSQDLTDLIR